MVVPNLKALLAVPGFLSLFIVVPASKAAVIPTRDNVPQAVQQAVDSGPVSANQEMILTLQLKLPDQAAFDEVVEQLYNPSSPTHNQWLTEAEMRKYAPTAAQVALVRSELARHGLTVISNDPLGFSLRVHGTAANIEAAFGTHLHQFTSGAKTFTANIESARLTGEAGNLIAGVSGLVRQNVHPLMKRAIDIRTGKPILPIKLAKVYASGGLESVITDQCFSQPKAFTFETPGSALPAAVYFGNDYADGTKVCDFTPAQLQRHYGLPAAYRKGLDGTGRKVVLLEAYGYPTMVEDANAFSALNGLPALDASNFQVIYPEGPPINPNAGILTGWDGEIALDIQWAHSIAPKAKIIVVAAAGQDNEDLLDAISYITAHRIGYSVSDSWGVDIDAIAGPLEIASFEAVLQRAAAQGVSFHFSSGDSGDNQVGSPIGAPSVPSQSRYVTAVGGTSILNNLNGLGQVETGWGNDLTVINDFGPLDPPEILGFVYGAGGGESITIPKPAWQAALPGTGRQVPDISALSDPYTGVPIVLTQQGTQYLYVGNGGTSLASPIFTAIWTLSIQNAGHPLGQAARRIANMSSTEVRDIVPPSSPFNVSGTIVDSAGAHYYSPSDLFSGALYDTTQFVSAVWPISPDSDYVLGFGLDTSLTVTKGWDNVTGFGVPNGLPFINAAAGK